MKHGEVTLQKIGRTPLDVGDTLLIQGHRRDIERARRARELLVLGQFDLTRFGNRAWITVYTDPTADGYSATRVFRRGESLSPLACPTLTVAVDDVLG